VNAADYRRLWQDELDGAATYRTLAQMSRAEHRDIYGELAAIEERHAEHWAQRLVELGEVRPSPSDHTLGVRTRIVLWIAHRYGVNAVLPLLRRAERAGATAYAAMSDAGPGMAHDELAHAATLKGVEVRAAILGGEKWHRSDASGSLRAAIFGVNDGLVANLSLVMGVAGGEADRHFILLAGLAGLLAGAFSMGVGEFVSVSSQRELFEREIQVEADEVALMPEEEAKELALIYRAKGLSQDEAQKLAARIMSDPKQAVDTLAREELGLNPDELGSPFGVAASSFASFVGGAIVPVVPYMIATGAWAFVGSIVFSAIALFAVGAGISVVTGRSLLRAGLRQLLVGALAAGATFGIGRLIGVSMR